MSTRLKRDVRRFLAHRYTLLDVPNTCSVRLGAVWKQRFGYFPHLPNGGAVAGWHFPIDGGRAVVIGKPDPAQVSDAVQREILYLIGAKYGVNEVRLATSEETPANLTSPRVPRANGADAVEQWPSPLNRPEPVVLEHSSNAGWYVHESEANSGPFHPATYKLDEALVFSDAETAYEWLELKGQPEYVSVPGSGVRL